MSIYYRKFLHRFLNDMISKISGKPYPINLFVGNTAKFSFTILSERISSPKLSFKSISIESQITTCCVCKVGVLQQTLSNKRTLCISSLVKSTRASAKSLRFFDKFIGASETKSKEEFATASLFCMGRQSEKKMI